MRKNKIEGIGFVLKFFLVQNYATGLLNPMFRDFIVVTLVTPRRMYYVDTLSHRL
jgi:hypothetical protein